MFQPTAQATTSNLAVDGFEVRDPFVSTPVLAALRAAADEFAAAHASDRRAGGIRQALERAPALASALESSGTHAAVREILGPDARLVRSILFDKTPDSNWAVPWHQDVTIAVAERIDTPGFGPWSVKAGVIHVQPPAAVLARMLTMRISLDENGPDNGPLLVLPGTHAHGMLDGGAIDAWKQRVAPVACTTRAAGAVLMRPLLLHASAKAERPGRRRVLHLEYAASSLPNGLRFQPEVQAV